MPEELQSEAGKKERLKLSFAATALASGAALFCVLLPFFFFWISTRREFAVSPGSILWYLLFAALPVSIAILLFGSIGRRFYPRTPLFKKPLAVSDFLIALFFVFGAGVTGALITNLLFPSAPELELLGRSQPLPVQILLSALLPAVLEELLYRGVILRLLLPVGFMFSIFLSSLLFALSHMTAAQFLPALFSGVLLALAYHRTKSLLPGMAAHFFYNAANLFLLWSQDSLPLASAGGVALGFMAFSLCSALFTLFYLVRRIALWWKKGHFVSPGGAYYIFGAALNPVFIGFICLWAAIVFKGVV